MRNIWAFGVSSRIFCYRFFKKVNSVNIQWKKSNYQTIFRNLSGISEIRFNTEENSPQKVIIPEKFNFASDVLDEWAKKEKNGQRSTSNPAFWYVYENGKELKYSFQELEYHSKKVANVLQNCCGIKRGDLVIVMLPRIPEFWLVNIASLRIGFILSSATMMLTAKDLAFRLSALKATSIIAHESVADLVEEAAHLYPALKSKIIVSDSPNRRKGWLDMNHLQPVMEDHKCAETKSDETMMIFFTSGTTGKPKMVEHAHSYGLALENFGYYLLNLTSDKVAWSMADTGWGLTAYSLFGTWIRGACLFIHQMSKFCPKVTLEILKKYPVNTLMAAPLVYRSIVQEDLKDFKFNELEHCASAGEKINIEVIKKWMAHTGLKIYEGYGQTESTGMLFMHKFLEYRIGSTGKPMKDLKVAIIDKNKNELGPGVTGEIVLERKNAFGLFKGYRDNPEATKAVFSEKYYHSGDLGYYDEDGYFYVVGRNDDLINSAGYRIGPSEVEDALMDHTAVVETAVVSSPDQKRGEVVKAFVVLREATPSNEALIKELQEHCKRVTAPYKYPRKIEFVKSLPKTISGKIKRSELKRKEWSTA